MEASTSRNICSLETKPTRSRIRGIQREADPIYSWGRPMTLMKKQVKAISETAGIRDEASKERFAEITSGWSEWQQGLVATCKDLSSRLRPK